MRVPVDFADLDEVSIRVYTEGGLRLAAAIELVSPANKDRPAHRRAFVAKCAAYLQKMVGVVVIDIVTNRSGNLHCELFELLELNERHAIDAAQLYACSYRTISGIEGPHLEVWPESLDLGSPVPTLPLWLEPDLAVPLDLEITYQSACRSLRIKL